MKAFQAIILFILNFGALSAQYGALASPEVNLNTAINDSDYIIEKFELPGGTLANNVNCIVEGPHGFLWFGTHAGVIRYDGHEFTTYTNEPGDTIAPTTSLTFPYTEHLYWDKEGYMWVSTYGGGLYKYDPMTEHFDHYAYDAEDSTTISNPRVTWANEDAEGRLWLTTEHGINRLDRSTGTFTRYYPFNGPEDIPNNTFRNIYLDRRGDLWFSGGNAPWTPNRSGLTKYDARSDSFIKYLPDPRDPTAPPSNATKGLLEDSDGNFWVGYTEGLYKMDRENGSFEYYGPSEHQPHSPVAKTAGNSVVHSMLEDHAGNLWLGSVYQNNSQRNLLKHDPKTKKNTIMPLNLSAWALHQSTDGTIWVAGAGISGQVSRIRPRSIVYDLSSDFGLYESTYNKVRHAINRGADSLQAEFLSGSSPTALGIDPKTGKVWGTHVGAYRFRENNATLFLSAYDPATEDVRFYHLPELNLERDPTFPGNAFGVVGIEIDQYGKVWGSLESDTIGLFSFDPRTQEVEQFLHDPLNEATISSNYIVDIYLDRGNNDLYLSTYEAGLNRFNIDTKKNTRISLLHPEYNTHEDFPIAVEGDAKGNLWIVGNIGNVESGVNYIAKLDPTDSSLDYYPLTGIRWEQIRDMVYDDKREILFLAPLNFGLATFDLSTHDVFLFNTDNGALVINNIRKILLDDDHKIWASTGEGKYIRELDTGKFQVIDKTNKYAGNYRDGVKSPDGKLYFNTQGPIDIIDPKEITYQESGATSTIKMVDLYVLGEKQLPGQSQSLPKPIWSLDKIELDHTAKNFGLRFTDFNYSGGKSTYQYRLYPFEENWNITDQNPLASYTNVDPGTYTFQVASSDNASGLKGEVINIQVIIHPPWWKTWWAYLAYIISVAFMLRWIIKTQQDKAIQAERERSREKELVQAKEIEKAYNELKTTQAQLVQSEKMASLGELTAGIAHEIQNPLNFVNNFSDVSGELIDEAIEELENNEVDEAKNILSDLKGNLEKISHHGGRASSIVKGMLDHSRAGSDEKVPTDINALCDEYLRLSYHGLRAKDKSFNSDFETQFDDGLSMINVVPQDIGRVLLNIVNNAFYTVQHKGKSAGESYKPKIVVATKALSDAVQIKIEDNGEGMSQEVQDKIFQPFFTTKPTGSGTGLGMSITYDIINKRHGGDIKISSEEGKGTTFTITIPTKG